MYPLDKCNFAPSVKRDLLVHPGLGTAVSRRYINGVSHLVDLEGWARSIGITSESKRSGKNIAGGGGGVSISSSSVTHVLVSNRVFRFGMSERINLTRAGGTSNDSGVDISSAPRSSNTNFRIQ